MILIRIATRLVDLRAFYPPVFLSLMEHWWWWWWYCQVAMWRFIYPVQLRFSFFSVFHLPHCIVRYDFSYQAPADDEEAPSVGAGPAKTLCLKTTIDSTINIRNIILQVIVSCVTKFQRSIPKRRRKNRKEVKGSSSETRERTIFH